MEMLTKALDNACAACLMLVRASGKAAGHSAGSDPGVRHQTSVSLCLEDLADCLAAAQDVAVKMQQHMILGYSDGM